MESLILTTLRLIILFFRNSIGSLVSPYITYRHLASEETDTRQTIFIPILIICYFIFASTLRVGIDSPFLLTVKSNLLMLVSFLGFVMMLGLFWLGGKIVKAEGKIQKIYTLWIFSLIPTLVWFFVTSLLYLILPPPRTMSFPGKLFSIFFIGFSTAMLFWKIMLYYLTLRFSLKIDLSKIILISFVVFPVLAVYSILIYRLGIFRIPFV